eukprot:jgi/Botrbrau1/260/Bobra.0022s0231.1
MLPLVCRRWNALLSPSSPHNIWNAVVMDLEDYCSRNKRLSWARFLRWLSDRAPRVRSLEVKNFQDAQRLFHDCPEGGLGGLFGALWPSLRCLKIVNCDSKIIRNEDLVYLSPFLKLETIHLIDQPGPIHSNQLSNFGYCTALQELRIVFAGDGTEQLLLGGFPDRWTCLTGLRKLELTSTGPNTMPSLPEGITNWQHLQDLELYRCGLRHLPAFITKLTRLSVLQIDGFNNADAQIQVPDTMSNLTSLKRLSLSGWSFEAVPPALSLMTFLQDLDMGLNPMQIVPVQYPCWRHIQALTLSCCGLVEIPEVLCIMDKLTSLDVSMNEQLSSLVEGLYLKNLKVLHLSRCNFREVPPDLAYAPKLRELDLSYNIALEMTPGAAGILLKLTCLESLLLRKNKLQPLNLPNGAMITPAAWTDKSVGVLLKFMREHALHHKQRRLRIVLCSDDQDDVEVLSPWP